MQVNTSASAMLPTIKQATRAEDDGKLVANSRGEFGMAFTFDPELADTVHNGVPVISSYRQLPFQLLPASQPVPLIWPF